MCSEKILDDVMQGFKSSYSKREDWISDSYPTWVTVLEPYDDRVVWLAYIALVSKSRKFPPTIGDLKKECDAKVKELNLKVDKDRIFCPDCVAHKGIVFTHAAYYRTDQNNTWVQSTRVCACICDDSRSYHPTLMTYQERHDKLLQDDRVQLEIYLCTNRDRVEYTEIEIDPVKHKMLTGDCDSKPENKYSKILDIIQAGNGHLLFPDKRTEELETNTQEEEDTRWQDSYDGYDDNPFTEDPSEGEGDIPF